MCVLTELVGLLQGWATRLLQGWANVQWRISRQRQPTLPRGPYR